MDFYIPKKLKNLEYKMEKQYVWCKLQHNDSFTSGYLELKPQLRVGVLVTLKDQNPVIWYKVLSMGSPKPAHIIERKQNWYKTNFVRTDEGLKSEAWK